MKLIDLLVKELPKRGGWPADAVTAIYFSHKQGVTFYDKDGMGIKNGVSFICMDINDVRREEVTKEEFEAALAKNDGWIEWVGGECPVETGVLVDVKYGCGDIEYGLKANMPDNTRFKTAAAPWWRKDGHGGDIIAYRLHRDINSRASDDRLEQDLNECIGQDVDPAWCGEGLPPVGCECEYVHGLLASAKNDNKPKSNTIVRVVAHQYYNHRDVCVCVWINAEGGMRSSVFSPRCLRPVRTEAEKLREAAIDAMTKRENMGEHWMARVQAIATYEAIAAGKIPGVNAGDK